jgi:acetyltransferase-like isoleucine patch superfamily enzyme
VIGSDVGDRCVIAAGSVVVKPVASHSLAGGNPARLLRNI